ncbi:MAG: DEAD/DEAH box helicase [Bacteroidaceae bacterium]|nr:DEAD/DEAH box helicase [Bacteroidaceae bacterium]
MKYDIPTALARLGISDLNPMQQEMLQLYGRERKIVLLSPTGSGKSVAYLLPLLGTLDADASEVQALVLVPSRELALQTSDVVKKMATPVRAVACYGGRPAMEEHRKLMAQQPQLVIGTPGRILDHMRKENLRAAGIRTLVIDEFDKCLELGFREQMADILALLRPDRCVLLSATDSPEIPNFVGQGFRRLNYNDADEQIPDRIAVHQVLSPAKDKLDTLGQLLCVLGAETSLVFVNYRESVERVGSYLQQLGLVTGVFHGGMEQRDRERALFRFSNGSANIFVSTDLASRGLDIPGIQNVIHYHLPLNEEAFIHRNGRTARWDAGGDAFIILGPEEHLPDYVRCEPDVFHFPAVIPPPSLPRWETLYIGKGKRDKINKVDIVGFLSKVGGLGREQLGRIDVLPDWSYAAVERTACRDVLARVRGQKIKGQKTIFALADK